MRGVQVLAVYNKDITCVIDKGQEPVCKVSKRIQRRTTLETVPSHDPYIPRNSSILYNCTTECTLMKATSMIDIISPNLFLKSCFIEFTKTDDYNCETIRYNHFKNADKLAFLTNILPNKSYYFVDCLVYVDGDRVCHKKDGSDASTGTMKSTRRFSYSPPGGNIYRCFYANGQQVCKVVGIPGRVVYNKRSTYKIMQIDGRAAAAFPISAVLHPSLAPAGHAPLDWSTGGENKRFLIGRDSQRLSSLRDVTALVARRQWRVTRIRTHEQLATVWTLLYDRLDLM
ncbi:hypothetical protein HW555_007422 [Spodoptera exigua]|uniref:Uncharacterized protein n=1 Tax=Spodoptera exigua TaxID=7107 RepID=A0A835L8Y9_SPOEX|nr:hypothetical protein HW555_007422 [Spodoptera exigua]